MKFNCLLETLGPRLAAVSHAVSAKASLPVLSHVLLEVYGKSLKLSATNLELSITTDLPVEVEEEGSACVPGRIFLDLVSNLSHGPVIFSEKNNILTIKAEKASSKINGINPAEFPKISTGGEALLSVDPKKFLKDLQAVVFSAASDESRPILTGILLEAQAGELVLVGVDGFRLSEKRTGVKITGPLKEVVPGKTLSEAARLLSNEPSLEILLSKEENQILLKSANFEIVCRLLEGAFPEYQKIIPQNFVTRAETNGEELKNALKIVTVFARDEGSVVQVKIDPEKSLLTLSASASEIGENETTVFSKIEGEKIEVAFNAKYLNDCLSNLSGEELEIKITGPLTPGVFVPVGKTDYLHLIMPIRVQG